jgi:hypothetical protein
MAKQSGLGDNFYVAEFDLSGDVGAIGTIASPRAVLRQTGIDKRAHERKHAHKDGLLEWSSWFNDAAGQAHPALAPRPTTDRIVSYYRGTTIGNVAACMTSKQINYDPNRAADGSLKMGIQALANGFGLEWARMLTAGKRTDGSATNGSSLDYGAAIATTNFGLQLYYHLFAFTGTSVTIKVQDSTDNSSFNDLPAATTGALTAVGSGRVVTGTTEQVDRYLRIATTGTFSNAVFAVAVVKNRAATVF